MGGACCVGGELGGSGFALETVARAEVEDVEEDVTGAELETGAERGCDGVDLETDDGDGVGFETEDGDGEVFETVDFTEVVLGEVLARELNWGFDDLVDGETSFGCSRLGAGDEVYIEQQNEGY